MYSAFEDRDGALWLGQTESISRVALNSPVSILSRATVGDSALLNGSLYTANFSGEPLSRLVPNSATGVADAHGLAGPATLAFRMAVFHDPAGGPDQLLAATGEGVLTI